VITSILTRLIIIFYFPSPEKFGRHNFDHEIKSFKRIIQTFDLLKNLEATRTIMRSKLLKALFRLLISQKGEL
jgi:hypothetical protein